ncbi:MAG: hypothetical protein WAT23_17295 [Chromatiaceae bacterium]
MTRLYFRFTLVVLALMLGTQIAIAGNKKLMTVNAAKVAAERAIVESVIGLKVRSRESVVDLVAQNVTVDAKTAAAIKGIEYTEAIYDPDKDIAQVVASIKLGRVSNIIGKNINFGGQTIQRVGFATSTPEMAGPLRALRAAELDAYKQLAKTIIGFKIDSNTTVEDFILKNDSIRAKMAAAIYGAELVGYRWDENGDAYVKMRLKFGSIQDVLGRRLKYDGEVVEVEGIGAQHDDFNQASTSFGGEGSFGGRTQIREATIDVPVGPDAAPIATPDSQGGGANLRP